MPFSESAGVLEPTLTKFDVRVLKALEPWPENWTERVRTKEPMPWLTAWAVAERMRELDVGLVQRTLRGFVHLGYADSRGWNHKQTWLRGWRGDELLKEQP